MCVYFYISPVAATPSISNFRNQILGSRVPSINPPKLRLITLVSLEIN